MQRRKRRRHSFAWILKRVFRNIRQELVYQLRRFLRKCYRLGAPMCIFLFCAFVFVTTGVVLLATIPARQRARTEAAAQTTLPAPQTIPDRSEWDIEPTAVPFGDEDYADDAAPTNIEPDAGAEESDPAAVLPADGQQGAPEPIAEVRYEKGSEGEDVLDIQKRLMTLGYLSLDEPTSYYGNATRDAVRFFQRQHALEQDGIIGNATYALLMSDEARPYVMMEGAEGDDIEVFQDMLYDLGYLSRSQVTGYYGTDTVEAVKKFQKRNKLSQDGKAGEKTIEMINSADARVSYTKEKEIEEEKKKEAKEAAKKTVEGRIDSMIKVAKSQLGKPYVLGAKGPDSYDCSGFVYYCLRKANVYCRRLNAAGYSRTDSWKKITSMSDLKKGDLIFFSSDDDKSVGHVGIYIGSGEMIDASSGNGKVIRRSCRTSYWKRNFVCGRRPIE